MAQGRRVYSIGNSRLLIGEAELRPQWMANKVPQPRGVRDDERRKQISLPVWSMDYQRCYDAWNYPFDEGGRHGTL